MINCYHKKQYYVRTRFKRDGGFGPFTLKSYITNYIATPHLGKAMYVSKRMKCKHRQIDVRILGKFPYVLNKSWL